MIFLVDTNIVVHARDGTAAVLAHFAKNVGSIALSALCLAELERGSVSGSTLGPMRRERLTMLLGGLPVQSFDEAAALQYGQLIQRLGWVRGCDYDRMIAAHALSLGATLVTNNRSDFRDIPDLPLIDWTQPAA